MSNFSVSGTLKHLAIFGIPVALFCFLVLLMKSPIVSNHATLSLAITIDLLLVVPLVYFLLIRKTGIPKTTVVPVMIAGLIIGFHFLPRENQAYLAFFKSLALPVIELSILVYLIVKVRSALKTYKHQKELAHDFFDALKSTCQEILPKKLALPLAMEVAVIYYGFINWKRRPLREGEFSYHKKSGSSALLGAFIMIIAVETVVFHLLLSHWNVVVAWTFSGLSIYTCIQIFGIAKSLSKRPIVIGKESLHLRYGILNEAIVPFSSIGQVELSRRALEKDKLNNRVLSPLGELESHNVVLHLVQSGEMVGIYGARRPFKVLALHIDEPHRFHEALALAMNRADF